VPRRTRSVSPTPPALVDQTAQHPSWSALLRCAGAHPSLSTSGCPRRGCWRSSAVAGGRPGRRGDRSSPKVCDACPSRELGHLLDLVIVCDRGSTSVIVRLLYQSLVQMLSLARAGRPLVCAEGGGDPPAVSWDRSPSRDKPALGLPAHRRRVPHARHATRPATYLRRATATSAGRSSTARVAGRFASGAHAKLFAGPSPVHSRERRNSNPGQLHVESRFGLSSVVTTPCYQPRPSRACRKLSKPGTELHKRSDASITACY